MSYNYGWEKLFRATEDLAGGTGDIRTRLADAVVYNLVQIRPEENLPPGAREDFIRLMDDYRRLHEASGIDTTESHVAWLASVDEETVVKMAKQVVTIFDKVARKVG